MEETISLDEIVQILKKKWVLIVSTLILGITLSTVVTLFLMTPKYSGTTQLMVQTKGNDPNISTDKINSNLLLINTYKDLIKSKAVIDTTKQQLEKTGIKNISDEELLNGVSVDQNQSSQIFSIKFVSTDPVKSAEIANTISEVFQQEASKVTDSDRVSVVSKATPNSVPISPNKNVNVAIGALLGLILGVMLALLSELLNRTVKTEEYVSEKLGLPILGIIPLMNEREMNEIRKLQQENFINEDVFFEKNDFHIEDYNGEVDGLDVDLGRLKLEHQDTSIY